jgi:hypothetical protein
MSSRHPGIRDLFWIPRPDKSVGAQTARFARDDSDSLPPLGVNALRFQLGPFGTKAPQEKNRGAIGAKESVSNTASPELLAGSGRNGIEAKAATLKGGATRTSIQRWARGITRRRAVCVAEKPTTLLSTRPEDFAAAITVISRMCCRPLG